MEGDSVLLLLFCIGYTELRGTMTLSEDAISYLLYWVIGCHILMGGLIDEALLVQKDKPGLLFFDILDSSECVGVWLVYLPT